MTLVSEIISDAYRESNIIPLGATPSTAQTTEALNRLNPILLSAVGNESGDELNDINYGGDYDESEAITEYIPANSRLILNLTAAVTLEADPDPYEGQRMAFTDVGGNLATYNVTVEGNGRTIEGAASVTLSTNGDKRQWLYRADTANWVKIEELEEADTMPFPSEFNDYFVIMLALRINPRYGQALSQESLEMLKKSRVQLRSRYRRKGLNSQTDPGLLGPRDYNFYSDTAFNRGRGWPY